MNKLSSHQRWLKKIKKSKCKIGGNSGHRRRQRSTRAQDRWKKPQLVTVLQLDGNHTPEPKDSVFMGLLGCKSFEDVDAYHATMFKKFNRKVAKALRNRVSPENRAILKALLTQSGASSIPMLTDESICRASHHMLRDALVATASATPDIEFGLVTIIPGEGGTSHFITEIERYESRKKADATLRAMAPNYFAIFELALSNSQGHPAGGQMLQDHTHAVISGPPGTVAKAQGIADKHASKFLPNFSNAPIINVKRVASDPVNLARVAAYLFKPPYKCMNWNPGKDGKPSFMNGSEKGDRYIRYLRLAQIRTMLRYEDCSFGSGTGDRIRSAMISFVRALAIRESANGRAVLHPDAISSFWVGLMPQIKADRWNLPIIKTRK